MSSAEDQFEWQCRAYELPAPEREYRFTPKRRFRFDFAWPDSRVAVEVQGGVWNGGKHGRGGGITKDYEKLNLAQAAGWRVFQFATGQVVDGSAVQFVSDVLRGLKSTTHR